MAKVYVTQEQDKRDITGALQYGEIEILAKAVLFDV